MPFIDGADGSARRRSETPGLSVPTASANGGLERAVSIGRILRQMRPNRRVESGAYRVEGSAIEARHSPRNALGAEKNLSPIWRRFSAERLGSTAGPRFPTRRSHGAEDELFAIYDPREIPLSRGSRRPYGAVVKNSPQCPTRISRHGRAISARSTDGAIDRPAQEAWPTRLETATLTRTAAARQLDAPPV